MAYNRQSSGTCIAWWYLSCGPGNAHCFIAVFLHGKRDDFMLEIAEGKSSMLGFPKDDHIVKPGWSWGMPSTTTRRQALARVLKYAVSIVEERMTRGFQVTHESFHELTGTIEDKAMAAWEDAHNAVRNGVLRETPRPDWWPSHANMRWLAIDSLDRRESLAKEGFNLEVLIYSVGKKKRRRRAGNGRIYRRVGRFTVYAKE